MKTLGFSGKAEFVWLTGVLGTLQEYNWSVGMLDDALSWYNFDVESTVLVTRVCYLLRRPYIPFVS